MGEYRFQDYETFAHEKGFDFSKRSSIGVGGKAEIAFFPKSIAEFTWLLDCLRDDGIAYQVVGNLTNVLPVDKDTDKAIICTRNLNALKRTDEGIFAYAGVQSGALLSACRRNFLSGAEFLYGIPCTVGGALYMNAGAGGKYLSEIVESVLVYREGAMRTLSLIECGYAYKESVFMNNDDAILGANFRLIPAEADEIAVCEHLYAERRAHLPTGKSMGCVFKNPGGKSAGKLIEECGLKGMRLGGVHISRKHANFIINDGEGTSHEIETLIQIIKENVFARFGVRLEEEIRRI